MIRGWCCFIDHYRSEGEREKWGDSAKMGGTRDRQQITFEFLNRICLLKGWGVKANLSRIDETWTKIFYRVCDSFQRTLGHETTKNATKTKEVKTAVPTDETSYRRYHKSTEHFCRLFWSWNLFEATFNATIFTAFDYSYTHGTQLKALLSALQVFLFAQISYTMFCQS